MTADITTPDPHFTGKRLYLDYVIAQLIELADLLDGDSDYQEADTDFEPWLSGFTGNSEDLEGNLAGSVSDLEYDAAELDQPGFVEGGQGI